jgi:hypothetical protein
MKLPNEETNTKKGFNENIRHNTNQEMWMIR